ncbi:hypothetical protein JW711_01030 [Candidatus Woesearchaeota archaeon]|nr:hypothetical protein [Candidatus Woesearchaeota archaeon]
MARKDDLDRMIEKELDMMIGERMSKEDRPDALFRLGIFLSEVGDVSKYITHDRELNPNARPHGSREDEVLAYGQVMVQLYGLMHARGIGRKEALKAGMMNWMDADWRTRKAVQTGNPDMIYGLAVTPFGTAGKAYVVDSKHTLEGYVRSKEPRIVVVEHAKPDIAMTFPYAVGYITDQGGITCHLANIIRGGQGSVMNMPCIVGTGNATARIKHGQMISMYAEEEKGIVELKVK